MKKYITIIVFLLAISAATAQRNSVTGQLHDALNNEPLAYANLGVLSISDTLFIKGATSDFDGKFEINGIDAGDYFLRVSYIGYSTNLISISVASKSHNLGNLYLERTSQILDAVEIVAEKLMYQYEADKKVYNVSEDPSVQGGTAADALQNAPGVWVDLEGNISLRGVSDVEIWINDKPSNIPADGLKTFLQQLPANSLERIEVMTNPSAKYSASGTAGVINIITKQKIKQDFLTSFGVSTSTQPHLYPWLSFVKSNERMKINSHFSHYALQHKFESENIGSVSATESHQYSYSSTNHSRQDAAWSTGHFDVEYSFSDKLMANIYVGGGFSNGGMATSGINEKTLANGLSSTIIRDGETKISGHNWHSGGSIYRYINARKHFLNLNIRTGQWFNANNEYSSERISGGFHSEKRFHTINNYGGQWYDTDLKYFNNFKEVFTFESGISANYSPIVHTSPINVFDLEQNDWIYSELYSNYKDAHANSANAFVSWSQKIERFTYKAGLRYEYRLNHLHSKPLQTTMERSYQGIYPSLHLSYQTTKFYSYSLSYSRRVQYPHIWHLDPFVSYLNEESIRLGNPELNPAYTNSYEAAFSKHIENVGYLNASLYQRRTDKSHTWTTEALYDSYLERYTLFSVMTNSGRDIFTGGDITFTYRPKPFVNIMINANLYNKDIYADLGTHIVERSEFTYDSKLSVNTSFLKKYQFQLMGFYRSKNPTLQGYSASAFHVNASLRADFYNRKLSVVARVQDAFHTQKNVTVISTPSLSSRYASRTNSQYFLVGITFRLGKIEMEKDQKGGFGAPNGGSPGV